MSETAPESVVPAAAPPVMDDAPKPQAPKAAASEFKYPANTPLADMSADERAEYWREKSQKHEKAWRGKAGDVTPDQVKELLEKARQFDEITEAQKTEAQKAADRATAAEKRATEAAAELARMTAAVKHGLTEDDLDLLGTHGTPEEIEARAEKLAARLKAVKPKADFGAGDRGTDVAGKAKQLSADDVKRLYAEKKYDEIEAARKDGRLADLLG